MMKNVLKVLKCLVISFAVSFIANKVAWFLIYRGFYMVWLAMFVILLVKPLVQKFMQKNVAENAKIQHSFSDTVCHLLSMVSTWADQKKSSLQKTQETNSKNTEKSQSEAMNGENDEETKDSVASVVQEIQKEMEENTPDPSEVDLDEEFTEMVG